MKIDRLLAITMHLLSRKKSTAGELAELFSVSKRTIYRDLETINLAGIPVVSCQGNGGGYSIAENFTIGRSVFKRNELKTVAGMLRSVAGAMNDPGLDRTVEKIAALGPREETGFEVIEDGIVLDLTPWWGLGGIQDKVSIIRKALKRKRPIRFSYTNLKGEQNIRVVEPAVLLLKGFNWFLYGFCRLRGEFRLFRLSRVTGPELLPERFIPRPVNLDGKPWEKEWRPVTLINLIVRFAPALRGRMEELFPQEKIRYSADGTGILDCAYPLDEWLYSAVLGLGPEAEVIGPDAFRQEIIRRAREIIRRYGHT
ncbi:MAG: helix-turn-helix transcriptional regulator [Spirochaetia bacterium]